MNLVCPHCRRSYPLDALLQDKLRSVSTIVCARCKRSFPAGIQAMLEADLESFEPLMMPRNGAPITRSAREISQALEGVSFADLDDPPETAGGEGGLEPFLEPAPALELALDVPDLEVTSSGSFRLDPDAIEALIGELALPTAGRVEAVPTAVTHASRPAAPAGPATAGTAGAASGAGPPSTPGMTATAAAPVPAVAAVLSRGAVAAREAVRQALGGGRNIGVPWAPFSEPSEAPEPAAPAARAVVPTPAVPEREPGSGMRPAPALSRGAAAAREAVRAALGGTRSGARPSGQPRGPTLLAAALTTSTLPSDAAAPEGPAAAPATPVAPAGAPEAAAVPAWPPLPPAREAGAPAPPRAVVVVASPAMPGPAAAMPVDPPAAIPPAPAPPAVAEPAPVTAAPPPPQGAARIRRSWLDLASIDLRSLINTSGPACEDLEWLLAWHQGPTRRGTDPSLPALGQRPRPLKP